MQSSLRNCLPVRLKTSSQSRALRRSGPLGARPSRASRSVAVDKGEPPEAGLRRALATAPREEPHRRADAPGEEEARAEGRRRNDGQVGPQLRPDVRYVLDLGPEVVDGVSELFALGLDLEADLLHGAAVIRGHRPSMHRSSASLP